MEQWVSWDVVEYMDEALSLLGLNYEDAMIELGQALNDELITADEYYQRKSVFDNLSSRLLRLREDLSTYT